MRDQAWDAIQLAKNLQAEAPKDFVPPSEGTKPSSEQVLAHSFVRGTRGYIERICYQMNGAYENGWYDACAVMMRRLIETLIIESFEHHKIDQNIKRPSTGNFLMLRDLIDCTLREPSWNLSRNTKKALPQLKLVGDMSAHSRRYIAHREDIDELIGDFRIVCQELIFLAELK